ncbi:MAG: hypothetical protein IPM81_18470 [Saprospirales bacterium]|nr:hypothetical protein [Saprospirales bacterium]
MYVVVELKSAFRAFQNGYFCARLIFIARMRPLFFGILPFLLAVSFTLLPGDAFGCSKGCSTGKSATKSIASEASCCASAGDEASCCSKNRSSTGKNQDHHGDEDGCGGRCGGTCGGHCSCPMAVSSVGLFPEVELFLPVFISFSRAYLPYQSPSLPNVSLDIWLPPNILS